MGVDNLDSLSYRSLATRPFVLLSDRPDHRRRAHELFWQSAKSAEFVTVRTFFGGQGSGITGGWAPDSKKFAWTDYETLPERGGK